MHIVEVFLPLDTGSGVQVEPEAVEGIVEDLADRFGGATAFTRAPADGLWKQGAVVERDRILIIEVMVNELNEDWWSCYRSKLEREFEQDKVLIRVTSCRTV